MCAQGLACASKCQLAKQAMQSEDAFSYGNDLNVF
jgi:hypothetical protein